MGKDEKLKNRVIIFLNKGFDELEVLQIISIFKLHNVFFQLVSLTSSKYIEGYNGLIVKCNQKIKKFEYLEADIFLALHSHYRKTKKKLKYYSFAEEVIHPPNKYSIEDFIYDILKEKLKVKHIKKEQRKNKNEIKREEFEKIVASYDKILRLSESEIEGLEYIVEMYENILEFNRKELLDADKTMRAAESVLEFNRKEMIEVDKTVKAAENVIEYNREKRIEIDKTEQALESVLEYNRDKRIDEDKEEQALEQVKQLTEAELKEAYDKIKKKTLELEKLQEKRKKNKIRKV